MTPSDEVDLLALWLLDALDPAEAEAVGARVAEGVPSTLAALEEARRVVGALALGTPEAAPPPEARARLLAAARAQPAHDSPPGDRRDLGRPDRRAPGAGASGGAPAPRPRATRWVVPGLIGATFLLLAVLNVWQGVQPTGVSPEDARYGRLLLDPRTERWVFKDPTTGEPLGLGIRDADSRRGWLSLKGLPAPDAGRTYVLWTIAEGEGRQPENRGAISLRGDRRIDLELPESIELRDVAALAVSLETDPATPTPTVVKALAKSPRS